MAGCAERPSIGTCPWRLLATEGENRQTREEVQAVIALTADGAAGLAKALGMHGRGADGPNATLWSAHYQDRFGSRDWSDD